MAANLPMATLGVQAAGAGMSTVGSYYSARNDRLNLGLQADLADTNARIAELGAQSALAQGAREEQRSRLQTAQLKSAQRTAMAANGIDLGEGTAAQVLTATDLMGDLDAETIRANAARSAWGYRTQAVDAKNQALIARAGAKVISPVMQTATSLLGSAGSVAQTWYQFNQAGAKGFGDKVSIKDTGMDTGKGTGKSTGKSTGKGKQTGSWW